MKAIKMIGLAVLTLILAGCTETKTIYVTGPDFEAPAAPRGVTSTTGDGQVWVDWYPNGENDLDFYRVWRAFQLAGPYSAIADVAGTSYIDNTVNNGTTYFYAVSAFDDVGNESALSPEDVYDTPRPEGSNFLQDFILHPGTAGFNFLNSSPYGSRVAWDNLSADIYLESDGVYFINVTNVNVDIQDMGYTDSFDDVSYSPTSGWSAVGRVEVILGHTYVIWTADDHYAKIRVTSVGDPVSSGVTIDWAYQLDSDGLGQLELKPAVKSRERDSSYLRRSIAR